MVEITLAEVQSLGDGERRESEEGRGGGRWRKSDDLACSAIVEKQNVSLKR